MWYFAWILGLGFAVAFGVLNGIWHEFGVQGDEQGVGRQAIGRTG